MKKLCLLLIFLFIKISAQTEIKGFVLSDENQAIPRANIILFNQKNEICRILTYFLIIKFFNATVKQNAKYWQQSTYTEKVRQASSIHRFYLFFQTAHIRILQFDLLKNYCTLSALSSLNCTVFRANTVQNKNTPFQSHAALFCQSR